MNNWEAKSPSEVVSLVKMNREMQAIVARPFFSTVHVNREMQA
ncbi:unnamed protein product, partial [Urochloa humidicola]